MSKQKAVSVCQESLRQAWIRSREPFWLIYDWCKFIVLLVVFSVVTLGIFAGAAERHWILPVLLMFFYGYGVLLGIMELRSEKLKTRQAAGSIILIIVLLTAVFSTVSFASYKLGLAHYEGNAFLSAYDRDIFLTPAFLLVAVS